MPASSRNKRPVYVTGLGVVSPLGADVSENLRSLREARDGITPVTSFDVSRNRCKTAGQIQDDWLTTMRRSKRAKRYHRSALMLIAAVREALSMARNPVPALTIMATSSGAMSNGEEFYRRLKRGGSRKQQARLVANYLPQKPVLDALDANNLRSPIQIVSNACSSGSNSIGHAYELVSSGLHDCVLCGGYDPLGQLVFCGFDALQAATPEKIRPFDHGRTGLVLGEGAATLILESEESARRRGAERYAELIGYGIATDNYHLTQPDPSGIGPRLAMERALQSAGLPAAAISYVNAHGTATVFNDATEGIAISQLFGQVPVSSTKSMMGHALGGAGAIEAIFCVLALRHQFLPPNINFRQPEPQWTFQVVANQAISSPISVVLSNSFGFGGCNASLIFRVS
jgi:3-oxoacyl-[acyl-carrier-protein] synthase II